MEIHVPVERQVGRRPAFHGQTRINHGVRDHAVLALKMTPVDTAPGSGVDGAYAFTGLF